MAYWLTLGRSFAAIALGTAILFYPDKARPLLGNFIGFFWIAGSLMSIRWGLSNERSRALTLLIGILGAVAGLLVVSRFYTGRLLPENVLDIMLGSVAMLTGVLHMTGHLQVTKFAIRAQTRSGTILGVFEVILGLTLLLLPWRETTLINYVAVGWALLGGIILFGDALAMRKEEKLKVASSDAETV